ncbi:iron-siderophore ABC transporter substrate-binding protein [Consotaella salsifontis]|uniref:Iron complex transport system substrate-binding protein n=1 Tax=Consotaella salsifontis TaxID=1365950 RepID=A0A1T4LV74_9HYPH|nr:iron-siderophore ABC transporter substrate-binding protein [Consotaella salsifontis]SJZ58536.1 iron complex transport system substrate-binding protein [Consotaella salsifontis]
MGFDRRRVLKGLGAGLLAPAPLLPIRAFAGEALRFVHAYGETVLPAPARRVVSLGYTTHDTLLALGEPPIAVRYWYGDYPFGVWPWAQPYLNGAEPVLLSGEVSMEKVAALRPDLIVAISSGISKAEYSILSCIAPVLMHEPSFSTYSTPWDVMTRTLGRALGRSKEAEALVARTRDIFAAARERNPVWAGKTAVAAYHWSGETGAFVHGDNRADFLSELGFAVTPKLRQLTGPDDFYGALSPEDLSPLDADILVWVSSFAAVPDLIALPMRKTLAAHREGREVFAGPLVAGAMSHGSVLSLPFALNAIEADLTAAADGSPETVVQSALQAGLAP